MPESKDSYIDGLGHVERIDGIHCHIILNQDTASKLPVEEAARRKAIQEKLESESSNLTKQIDALDNQYIKDKDELEKRYKSNRSSLLAKQGVLSDAKWDSELEIIVKE